MVVPVAFTNPVPFNCACAPKDASVWSPVLVPDKLDPVTVPVAATEDGVIAPSARLIAGVVVGFVTVPETPFALVTETEVTAVPPLTICHIVPL